MGLLLMLQVGGTRGLKMPQSYVSIMLLPFATAEQEENETNLYPLSWLLLFTLALGACIPLVIDYLRRPVVKQRRNKATQLNWKETNATEVERLTIETIKKELFDIGAPTTGVKADLVVRLAHYREKENLRG